jgi:regulatory protein YycI of two-component signal transduction system YycFG
MRRSKSIFIIAFVLFILLLIYVSYDISKRTSFPGSKSQLKERLKQKYSPTDTLVDGDTLDQKR